MITLMPSLINNIREYLIIRRVLRTLGFLIIIFLVTYYIISKETVTDLVFLAYSGIFLVIFLGLEVFNLVYKYFIAFKMLDRAQEIYDEDLKFQEERCCEFKKLLDEFIAHENDENLDEGQKNLIEKEKSGNGFLALRCLEAKVFTVLLICI